MTDKKYFFIPIIIIIVVVFCLYFLWPPCLPDLLVQDYTAEHVGELYDVDVVVKNDGCAKSDECLVYCNAISMSPPVGENEIRAQRIWFLEELQPGETATCSFSFNFQMLEDQTVGILEILVDSKAMVEESNENNNIELWEF